VNKKLVVAVARAGSGVN